MNMERLVESELELDDGSVGRIWREVLTERDISILSGLAAHPRGIAVPDTVAGLFAAYEGSGLVDISGSGGGKHFWAKITERGVAAVRHAS